MPRWSLSTGHPAMLAHPTLPCPPSEIFLYQSLCAPVEWLACSCRRPSAFLLCMSCEQREKQLAARRQSWPPLSVAERCFCAALHSKRPKGPSASAAGGVNQGSCGIATAWKSYPPELSETSADVCEYRGLLRSPMAAYACSK